MCVRLPHAHKCLNLKYVNQNYEERIAHSQQKVGVPRVPPGSGTFSHLMRMKRFETHGHNVMPVGFQFSFDSNACAMWPAL